MGEGDNVSVNGVSTSLEECHVQGQEFQCDGIVASPNKEPPTGIAVVSVGEEFQHVGSVRVEVVVEEFQ